MPAPPAAVPSLAPSLAKRLESGFWSHPCADPTVNFAPPACTPRRQLNKLLANAKAMDAQAGQQLKMMRSAPPPGPDSVGEQELARWGKKIDRQYLIITAHYAYEQKKLRFEVFNTRTETSHSLVCRHEDVLRRGDASIVDVAQAIALDLEFDTSGKLVFGPHVPASWVSQD